MEEEEQAEAAARAAGGAGGAGGMGGMPAGMEAMFSDPEIMKAMQNPKVMQAMMEMQSGGAWCLICEISHICIAAYAGSICVVIVYARLPTWCWFHIIYVGEIP